MRERGLGVRVTRRYMRPGARFVERRSANQHREQIGRRARSRQRQQLLVRGQWKLTPAAISMARMAATSQSTVAQKGGHPTACWPRSEFGAARGPSSPWPE